MPLEWTITNLRDTSLHISQPALIANVPLSASLQFSTPLKSPLPTKPDFDDHNNLLRLSSDDTTFFQTLLGELRYLADRSCSEVAHVTSTLAGHSSMPFLQHVYSNLLYATYLTREPAVGCTNRTDPNPSWKYSAMRTPQKNGITCPL